MFASMRRPAGPPSRYRGNLGSSCLHQAANMIAPNVMRATAAGMTDV